MSRYRCVRITLESRASVNFRIKASIERPTRHKKASSTSTANRRRDSTNMRRHSAPTKAKDKKGSKKLADAKAGRNSAQLSMWKHLRATKGDNEKEEEAEEEEEEERSLSAVWRAITHSDAASTTAQYSISNRRSG